MVLILESYQQTWEQILVLIKEGFEEDVYEAISMETCVNTRLTIGAPSKTAMEQVILLEEDWLKCTKKIEI